MKKKKKSIQKSQLELVKGTSVEIELENMDQIKGGVAPSVGCTGYCSVYPNCVNTNGCPNYWY